MNGTANKATLNLSVKERERLREERKRLREERERLGEERERLGEERERGCCTHVMGLYVECL